MSEPSTSDPGDVHLALDLKVEYTLEQLELMHLWHTPAYVVDIRLREGEPGWKDTVQVIFANRAATTRFGPIRPQEEVAAILKAATDAEAIARRHLARFALAGATRNVVHAQKIVAVLFSNVQPHEGNLKVLYRNPLIKTDPDQPARRHLLVQMEHAEVDDAVRQAAMQHLSPIQNFLFDQRGLLLMANQRAMQRYGNLRKDGLLTLLDLYKQGVYDKGGLIEMQEAYNLAMENIFVKKLPCHRFTQQRVSHKHPGQTRWVLFEMWPIQDPITNEESVMVSTYNVTSQKELELELKDHKDRLQRENEDLEAKTAILENEKAVMQTQQEELLIEKARLAEKLEAVIHDRFTHKSQINTDTPVDKTLNLLSSIIAGQMPSLHESLELYALLSQSGDLRQPVQLEQQLLDNAHLEEEVGLAMVQLLKGGNAKTVTTGRQAAIAARYASTFTSADMAVVKPPAIPGSRSHTTSLTDEASSPNVEVPRLWSTFRMEDLTGDLGEGVNCGLTTKVEDKLKDAGGNWQYDVFALSAECPERPLSLLTFHLLKQSGLVSEFRLDEAKLSQFLRRIEMGYQDNPYHNRMHAANVVQTTHMLVHYGDLQKRGITSKVTRLASYLAAAIHDYDHKGVNNDFLTKTHHELAITYNDQSPLENHHLAASFRLLLKPQYNFLKALPPEEQQQLRTAIVEEVLSTDMKRHFNLLSNFQGVFQRKNNNNNGSSGSSMPAASAAGPSRSVPWGDLLDEEKSLARQLALKCADIGHLAAPPEQHKKWALMLEEEFFRQGDKEKKANLKVSALMDRSNKGGITRSQVGFFNIVGIPLFQSFVEVFEGAQPLLDNAVQNYRMWQAAEQAATQAAA
ncbi:hypothetical protein WJX72_001710 [[Myrmecia] bisecta]|uniref:Phosphodiesterase n=1 Tax=[Myrmecia] bisecta TaxID=41462 RepID=A0AAW1QEA1_9CHLO